MEKVKDFVLEHKKEALIFSCLFIIIVIFIIVINCVKQTDNGDTNNVSLIVNNEEKKSEEIVPITIDIKGEIKNPGVYELKNNSRIIDAINVSGGLTNNANTSSINLSKILFDEAVVIIPSIEIEKCDMEKVNNDGLLNDGEIFDNKNGIISDVDNLININTASLEELMTLTGIGESKANAIILYREENGNFESIEDLMLVSGIGEKMYASIKKNITVR